jgi:hypothetical protein
MNATLRVLPFDHCLPTKNDILAGFAETLGRSGSVGSAYSSGWP